MYPEAYIGPFLVGIVGAFLFRFRNEQHDFLNILTILVLVISLIELHLYFFTVVAAQVTLIAVGAALVGFYLLRFTKKPERKLIDWLKIPAVVLIASYPIILCSWHLFSNGWTVRQLSHAIVSIVFFVYFYDRFVLKPTKMKTKFVAILVVQSIAILMFLIFAFYQQTLAEASRELARENAEMARESQFKLAEAERKLEDCK